MSASEVRQSVGWRKAAKQAVHFKILQSWSAWCGTVNVGIQLELELTRRELPTVASRFSAAH